MQSQLPARVEVAPNVVFQDLQAETVLLNIRTESYFGLDDIGTLIWKGLAEHGDPVRVIADLEARYEVDRETVTRDITDLIGQLVEANLLIPVV